MTLPATLLAIQGGYWLLTGLWPVLHLHSFLYVTGPKTDLWLVRVVGALVAVVGGVLLAAGLRENTTPEIIGLAVGGASVLMLADLWFVAEQTIAPIYLMDALVEFGLLAGWGVAWYLGRGALVA
jgi:hypothetical protein